MHGTAMTLDIRASSPAGSDQSASLELVPMASISLLDCARMERTRRHIRDEVVTLRRRKLILCARRAQPERNAKLDPLLATLQYLRVRFEVEMQTISAERLLGAAKDQTLICAGTVTSDIDEMIELLCWFGAEGGDDSVAC
jgi:hypothetical protein